MSAQVRSNRRGAVAKGDDGAVAAGPRGAAVKGEDAYAAAGRRGAVVSGEEGYAAVGKRGNVVTGDDIDVDGVAVGRRGAVVVGEEGAAAVGRYGNAVVGNRYESYDAWRAVAAVGTGIAIGTMLAKPPAAATTVVVSGSDVLLPRQRVLHASDERRVGGLPGRRASARGDHLDASRGVHERACRRRGGHAVWHHVLHARVDGLPGGGPELMPQVGSGGPADRQRWRTLVPVALLMSVAGAQVVLTRASSLSPWKGGGFGMFSTTDDAGRRSVKVFVTAPNRSEEIAVTPSLEDAAARAAVLPNDWQLTRLARRVVERERRHDRPVETVRIETWRIAYAPGTLTATLRLVRDSRFSVDGTGAIHHQ